MLKPNAGKKDNHPWVTMAFTNWGSSHIQPPALCCLLTGFFFEQIKSLAKQQECTGRVLSRQ